MKNFVKSILCAVALLCCTTASAQMAEGDNGVGVNFSCQAGNLNMSNFGIGIKYNHMFTDALRFELSGAYYFKGAKADVPYIQEKVAADKNKGYRSNKDTDWFDINLNAHYLFNVADRTNIYPIFGFSTMFGMTKFNIADKGLKVDTFNEGKFFAEITDSKKVKDEEGNEIVNSVLKENYTDHHFSFGVNLGFGAQYDITDDFALTLEAKYKLATNKCSNFNIGIGCVVLF